MSTKSDPVSEIQSIFLEKDEVGNMMLDNVFGIIDEQIDLAESRIMRGERPSLVFANMRAAMARMPGLRTDTRPDVASCGSENHSIAAMMRRPRSRGQEGMSGSQVTNDLTSTALPAHLICRFAGNNGQPLGIAMMSEPWTSVSARRAPHTAESVASKYARGGLLLLELTHIFEPVFPTLGVSCAIPSKPT